MCKKIFFPAIFFFVYAVTSAQNNFVTLYEDCNYKGKKSFLEAGTYNLYAMKIDNDKLSCLQIPPGMKVTIYADNNGFTFLHAAGKMKLTKGTKTIGGKCQGTLYKPFICVQPNTGYAQVVQTLQIWHQCLGHPGNKILSSMLDLITSMKVEGTMACKNIGHN